MLTQRRPRSAPSLKTALLLALALWLAASAACAQDGGGSEKPQENDPIQMARDGKEYVTFTSRFSARDMNATLNTLHDLGYELVTVRVDNVTRSHLLVVMRRIPKKDEDSGN